LLSAFIYTQQNTFYWVQIKGPEALTPILMSTCLPTQTYSIKAKKGVKPYIRAFLDFFKFIDKTKSKQV